LNLGAMFRFSAGPNPGGLLGQVQVATDHSSGPTHGNVYVLASVGPIASDPLDVVFSRSTDGGLTFSTPVRINDDPAGTDAWQWFGTMSVAPGGRIDVIWNDTRNSGVENLSELYYSYSYDAGITWSANVPISPMFDSHVGWPQQNKLGDYYDMISDNAGASLAWAATFNGEQDVYFLRIVADCNENGIPDQTDISDGTSDDCNANNLPDECEPDEDCNDNGVQDICDIGSGASDDVNGNGIPDECECTTEPVFPPAGTGGLRNRYLPLVPENAGLQTALRVTPVSVPDGFESLEGKHFWVGEPRSITELAGQDDDTPPVFTGANLSCAPHYADWGALGRVHVFDDEIVPGATYKVQAIIDGCPLDFEPNFSGPSYVVTAALWGDVTGDFYGGQWTGPNGRIDFLDITAVVEKFRNLPSAPSKVRVDLAGGDPDAIVDFTDISVCVDAFRGFAYPYGVPDDCP